MSTIERRTVTRTAGGAAVDRYELANGGLRAAVLTYGAIVSGLHVPDRRGRTCDVVLGFDNADGYLTTAHPYFGAIVGRVANRIGGAAFTLDGVDYQLAKNDGPHALHGGLTGFDKVVWEAEASPLPGGVGVRLTRLSPSGEEGYPGGLAVAVTYTLTDDRALKIDYEATTTEATPVNLTHHGYFNLAGPGQSSILGHVLTLFADRYTPVDATLIPTGAIAPVEGTPFDFRSPTPIGDRIGRIGGDPGGYDHNYVLAERDGECRPAARVFDPSSGRSMELWTTEPGVQFYSGNFLDGTIAGKSGVSYRKHQGLCLEAQHFPDAVHRPEFPSIILRPGMTYAQSTLYRFAAE